ncbi:unnamed protein product [Mucor hiemalis]
MAQQRRKKTIEYHFVDMNDPDRYKKLKVARACDFCRRRKSKCDVGIPGSGTCSNCKKSNQLCIFSPVNPTSSTSAPKATSKEQQVQQLHKHQQYDHYSTTVASEYNNGNNKNDNIHSFTKVYEDKFPFFCMNGKAYCRYEKDVVYTHITLASTTVLNEDIPVYSKQIEQELFDIYFNYVHPFFPVLDKYYTLQSLKFDNESLPLSLKWAVMSIVLSRFSNHHQDSSTIANLYHQHAINQLQHLPNLVTVQTLLLLYKYQEMITPVGAPIASTTISYLKEAQSILMELQKSQEQKGNIWTVNDEFVCRSGWILFIILALGNTADDGWRTMLQYCQTPFRMPTITETEPYDRIELNTTCNLIHLIDTALLYSQAICTISDRTSLFDQQQHDNSAEEEFNKLAHGVQVWVRTLSEPLLSALSNPPNSNGNNACSTSQQDRNVSFTNYICLIYDILQLLIAVHQPTQPHDLSKKALSVCIRAYNFTVGDVQAPQFSRLASIQGSRIVSFGLTLALQTHAYYQQQSFNHQDMETFNKFYSSCTLSFQVFDQIPLSPQLYMSIQTYHSQIESKKQLQQRKEPEQNHAYILQHPNSNNSSSNSIPSIHHGFDGTTSSSNSSSYSQTSSSTPNTKNSVDSSYYFAHHSNQHHDQNNGWNQYAYTTNDYSTKYEWNFQQPNNYFSQQNQSPSQMPITPTLESNMDSFDCPSPLIAVDSYFQPRENLGASVMVSARPYDFINSHSIETLYDAKSCKNDCMLR